MRQPIFCDLSGSSPYDSKPDLRNVLSNGEEREWREAAPQGRSRLEIRTSARFLKRHLLVLTVLLIL